MDQTKQKFSDWSLKISASHALCTLREFQALIRYLEGKDTHLNRAPVVHGVDDGAQRIPFELLTQYGVVDDVE